MAAPVTAAMVAAVQGVKCKGAPSGTTRRDAVWARQQMPQEPDPHSAAPTHQHSIYGVTLGQLFLLIGAQEPAQSKYIRAVWPVLSFRPLAPVASFAVTGLTVT